CLHFARDTSFDTSAWRWRSSRAIACRRRDVMPIQICNTCGTSYPDTPAPPDACPICDDERQYIGRGGQTWITPARLSASHANAWRHLEPDLLEINTAPTFAIGQRALLLRTPHGNILWDCISLF